MQTFRWKLVKHLSPRALSQIGNGTSVQRARNTEIGSTYYGYYRQAFTCVAIVALCTTALLIHGTWHGSAEADPATIVVQPGHLLTRGSFEVIINTSGFIQPVEVVDVGAQVSGQLMRIDVKLGERVEQGQFVAEIDDRLIQARIAQAEAAIENLRAQINAKKAQLGYARAHQLRTDTLVER